LSLAAFARLDRSAVLLLIAAYCLVHWGIRLVVAPVYTIEEAEHLLLSQSFQPGYSVNRSPLASWLFAALAHGPGLSPPAVFAVKYGLLALGLVFYYLAARNVLHKRGLAAAAVGAWTLTVHVGWGMHEDLLGGVALFAALAVTLHAFTRILTWNRRRDWLWLGVAIGFGATAHHLYIVFPIALMLATAGSEFFRGHLTTLRVIGSFAVGALVALPYLAWLAQAQDQLAGAARQFVESWDITPAYVERLRAGATSFVQAAAVSVLPLAPFWLAQFWTLWLPVVYPVFARRSTDEERHETAWRRLLPRATLVALVLLGFGLAAGVQSFRAHWMLPVMFCVPLWLFIHVRRAGEFPVAIRAFAAVIGIVGLSVIGGRFAEWRLDVLTCREGGCRAYAPMDGWAEHLAAAGFSAGTLVGADPHLTGNLRARLPGARAVDASFPPGAFPPPAERRGREAGPACLAVWRGAPEMPPALAERLRALGVRRIETAPEGAVQRTLLLSEDRAATLYYRFLQPSSGCR
jgi:zinc transporter ZupT